MSPPPGHDPGTPLWPGEPAALSPGNQLIVVTTFYQAETRAACARACGDPKAPRDPAFAPTAEPLAFTGGRRIGGGERAAPVQGSGPGSQGGSTRAFADRLWVQGRCSGSSVSAPGGPPGGRRGHPLSQRGQPAWPLGWALSWPRGRPRPVLCRRLPGVRGVLASLQHPWGDTLTRPQGDPAWRLPSQVRLVQEVAPWGRAVGQGGAGAGWVGPPGGPTPTSIQYGWCPRGRRDPLSRRPRERPGWGGAATDPGLHGCG